MTRTGRSQRAAAATIESIVAATWASSSFAGNTTTTESTLHDTLHSYPDRLPSIRTTNTSQSGMDGVTAGYVPCMNPPPVPG